MSGDQEATRIVRAWLRTDEHESAARVLESVLATIDSFPQRRPLWSALRTADRKTVARFSIAAAAVAVIAVVGFGQPSDRGGVVGGSPAVSASPSSAATSPGPVPLSGPIDPGSYYIPWPDARIHLALPAGWWSLAFGQLIAKDASQNGLGWPSLGVHDVTRIANDLCSPTRSEDAFVPVGPTVDDLVAALVRLRGVTRDGPSDAMLGGYPARKVVLVRERPCSGPEGSILTVGPREGDTIGILDGGTLTIYVVDVEGQRLVISTFSRGSSDADVAELEGVVASLAIEREPGATPTIEPLFPAAGLLAAGRHDATVDGVLFSFELPSPRWKSSGINSARNGGWITRTLAGSSRDDGRIAFWSPDFVYADPCGHVAGPAVGPSAADLAAAVATIPGTVADPPRYARIGERRGQRVTLTVRDDIACRPTDFYLWADETEGPRWATEVGMLIRFYVVEVAGARIVVEAESYPGSDPVVDREIIDIVSTIVFEKRF